MKEIMIGNRIQQIRESLTNPLVSQSDLARAIGVTPQAVQKWEAGKSDPRPTKIAEIAAVLHVSVADLVAGTKFDRLMIVNESVNKSADKPLPRNSEQVSRMQESFGKLPLISWEHANKWGRGMASLQNEGVEEWIPFPLDHGIDSFVVRIDGEANYDPTGLKSYAPGDFVAIDPSKEVANRCMVMLRMPHETRATFRQLLMEGDVRMLKWLNPSWPNQISQMPADAEIIGVAIGKWVPE
ncbi:helix-turn-helix domain-containing protein [Burkholderia aenigmatica]|uniref:helix-turn-helix domain-containing protein n=1 Tax=Burkholderia aenigmatica TaxID=2015348 RepID=UPI0015837980|nr:XRE family transcriptional regulator [Burkholderia aenigmatica]